MNADVNVTYEVSVAKGGHRGFDTPAEPRTATAGGLLRLHPLPPRRSPSSVHLTFREAEILELIANEGPTLPAIAERLWISSNTVKNHVQNLLRKTKCHTRAQLVAWAWRHGFIWFNDGERRIAIVMRAP